MTQHRPREAYDGPAVVLVGEAEHPVSVTLRGAFSPLDGQFHWYGRVADSTPLATVRSGVQVTLRTDHGDAVARLSDVDTWGRFRITGTGVPPF
jgi:hypothetical protein